MKSDALTMTLLFDYYGDLLTEKQRTFFDLHYNQDLSLSEIAEDAGITRQGVHDTLARAEAILLDMVLLKLEGVDTVEAAAALRGRIVSVRRDDAALAEGRVFVADLLGLPVFDGGREIGKLQDVLTMPAGDVYVVKGEREYLIPAVPAFVEQVDPDAGRIVVHLIEGMASDAV